MQRNQPPENDELWRAFYQKTLNRKPSPWTKRAIDLNRTGYKVAVDCGCGTGADIHYLSNSGYQVHGFDIQPEAIRICHERFSENALVEVENNSFEEYDYPSCGVMIAMSSLYFADPIQFESTWQRISDSLVSGGVFAGGFLGPEDSWVSEPGRVVTPLRREQVELLFEGYEIIEFHERNEPGKTKIGNLKHWHTFFVLAVKI